MLVIAFFVYLLVGHNGLSFSPLKPHPYNTLLYGGLALAFIYYAGKPIFRKYKQQRHNHD